MQWFEHDRVALPAAMALNKEKFSVMRSDTAGSSKLTGAIRHYFIMLKRYPLSTRKGG
jgi:hypothetical protein